MKSINKHIITAALLLLLTPAFAQVQKGYVRTVGRPDNREGERISGITIRVAGLHNPFVSGADGTFEFNLGGDKTEYRFTNILDNKFQYDLQEKELLGRKELVSATVEKEIVMVSLKEKQVIENKKREQIESQYQRDLKRLEDQLGQEKITIEKYREEHPDVAKSYNNIGEVYDNQGDYAKAMENYCTAYKIRHSILGADHPKTKDIANNIEKTYGKLKENPTEDSEKAIRLYEQWKEQYGGEK